MQKWLVIFIIMFPIGASAEISKKLRLSPFHYLSGESVNLEKFKGKKPVYIKFWASWCHPCLAEMHHFQEVQKKYGNSIEIIGVNLGINDTTEDANKVIDQFGLTMPTAYDKSGQLAKLFRFVGTPYHLIFDKALNLVHRGHKADDSLDNKLSLLATEKSINPVQEGLLNESSPDLVIESIDVGYSALFFTATWCDWYLKDSKPNQSKNCEESQNEYNKIVKEHSGIKPILIVSGLWTAGKDLSKYKDKYRIDYPAYIDKSNNMFMNYEVKNFPTFVLLENGVVKYKTTHLNDKKVLKKVAIHLTNLSSG